MKPKTKFRTAGVTAVAILLLAILAVTRGVISSDETFSQDDLVEVVRGNISESVVATGSVEPVTTVQLKSKASGLVKQIFVEEGDSVTLHQVLIQLDREVLEAQLREATANRTASVARAQQAEAEVVSARTLKKKMRLDVKNLEDNVSFQLRQVERFRTMAQERIIAHSELDRVERDYQEATLDLEALRSELIMQDARIEASRKAVSRMQAEVTQADATLDRAEENLRHTTIRSPISGTVLKRHIEVGDAVSSILQMGSQATLMMTLGDMSRIFVEGRVDENDIGGVSEGQQARIRVDAFRDRIFPGRVLRIAPLGEEEDNIIGFQVRVSISDEEGILRAHMSANAEVILEEHEGVLVVPESVIIYDSQRNSFVELYDPSQENLLRRVPVEIGIGNGTSTEVTSGLSEGDLLLAQPVHSGGPL